MSWVTILWSMVASACLTLAAMHLLIWGKKRTVSSSLLFAVTALATAAMAGGELWLMWAKTPQEFGAVERWSHVLYWVVIVSLVAFVRLYMRTGRPWLAWTVCGLRTVSLLLNFLTGENLNYRSITRLGHVHFLGDSVATAEGIANPWMLVGQASLLLFMIFVADATIAAWRRGDRRHLALVGSAIVCFVLGGSVKSALTALGVIHQPVTPSLFFLGLVAVMAYDMSLEVYRATQLSEKLRQSEAQMTLAAEAVGLGVWMWTMATNRVWGSKQWLRLFGFEPDEDVSYELILQRIQPDDREKVDSDVRHAINTSGDYAGEYRVMLPEGIERWIAARGRAYPDERGKPARMLGAAIDITERKHAEAQIEEQRNELLHVTRVTAMGQLTSSLAHELNQPLGAILRNAEAGELFLQEPSPDLDELRAILADIRKDDQRAGDVIDRVRDLMKGRKSERNSLDLNLLVGTVVALLQPDVEKRRVRLALETDPALPPIHGDRVQLQQVFLNLLLNAMDALEGNVPENRLVTVRARHVGATVEVTVRDTGHGIPVDTLAHVFEPFFSSKPDGLGMGLAISRSIIEAHGGRLQAENNAAGGAAFVITLPAEGGDAK